MSVFAAQGTIASALVLTPTRTRFKEITVTAQRLGLLGKAARVSEGAIDGQELQLTPQYRPGHLLETASTAVQVYVTRRRRLCIPAYRRTGPAGA
jgi:hypothetical protein